MISLRNLLVAVVVPVVLSACQSAQFGSLFNDQGVSSFSGDRLNAAPVTSRKGVAKVTEPKPKVKKADNDKAKGKPAKSAKKVAKKKFAKRSGKKLTFKQRRAKYKPIIAKYARKHGVPVRLAMAVVEVESSFRANATGRVGEIGLMQLLPRTARYIGVKGDLKNLYDPDMNIRYGMKYLGGAHKRAGGKTCRTILKYNAGHHATRMNPMSADYCKRVAKILRRG
ncbi:MAG: transglycosylase SLT domain-containing protein [Pseudomonadota bacterium]